MEYVLALIIVLVIWAFIRMSNTVSVVRGHWQHLFDTLQFSSQEFYQTIEQAVKSKEMPHVKTSRLNYSEAGVFSANREYLRVARGKVVFDVCAAPFAKGFFISSWHAELPEMLDLFFSSLPVIGILFKSKKTYYQIDTEQMFAAAVHQSILEAIDQITNASGIRQLSESDRIFQSQK
ncbi:MAG: hypothetical protein JWQ09_280 [Segetibacter sp.]|nr:hypothetical protein [Segetibacter sp.]